MGYAYLHGGATTSYKTEKTFRICIYTQNEKLTVRSNITTIRVHCQLLSFRYVSR
jgi:hypothetical protein